MRYKGLSVTEGPLLAELTTLRLGGKAIARVTVESEDGLEALPEALGRLGGSPVMLGHGSNILAGGGELPLVVVTLGRNFHEVMPEIKNTSKDSGETEKTLVRVSSATPLPLLLGRLVVAGLGGLTGLAGIPGQVGGSIVQNAGSFGHELKDSLYELTLFSPLTGLVTIGAHELDFSYRHFSIPALCGSEPDKNWFIITNASFACVQGDRAELRAHMRECLKKKRGTQPVGLPSAGCVFKNPPGEAAGRLLDAAGLKCKSLGGMSFSQVHANFMINNGKGNPDEAFELIELARRTVREFFGVHLQLEIRVWV